jgi:protein TonB
MQQRKQKRTVPWEKTMDLQSELIESSKKKEKGKFRATALAVSLHAALIAVILYISANATHKVDAEEKPIRAFISQGAAPPPPPPPPPPPAASSTPKSTPKVTLVKPVHVPQFTQPKEIPTETPKVEPVQADLTPSTATETPANGGEVGGVAGGVEGGIVGGEVGGVTGGELGGVKGGVVGGTLGGEVGGTGTGTAGEGTGDQGPLHVGGDVKAPVAISRVEPAYNDLARKSRVTGVVIVEAIIDSKGKVDQVRVLKGLPLGLSEAAENAVKQWRFKPATLNGQPVEVVFSLTVNFTLG